MEENLIIKKSFEFAVRIVNLFRYMHKYKGEYHLSKQILRSGTAIGANIEEASGGISRKDFINKLSIAYKEARETHYWLRLLHGTKFITAKMFRSLEADCTELCKILYSIIRTSKSQ